MIFLGIFFVTEKRAYLGPTSCNPHIFASCAQLTGSNSFTKTKLMQETHRRVFGSPCNYLLEEDRFIVSVNDDHMVVNTLVALKTLV